MNEFKFSCPNCRQSIQATPEYSGMQINCPSCQTPIEVPQVGVASAAAGPKSKLTKAESTVQQPATSAATQTQVIRKKTKPRLKLYLGLGAGALVVGAAILLVPKATEKYQEHKDAVAAAVAATNTPPPPPELNANEILAKVGATYKGMSSFSVKGESVATIDLSEVNPAVTEPVSTTTQFSILLKRPDLYRIEWDQEAGPRGVKGAAWSAGKGDYVATGGRAVKMKNRDVALTTAGMDSRIMSVGLAPLFFDATNSLATMLKDYEKTNNETIEGHKCYVLSGHVGSRHVLYWIHKDDFLIEQCELFLGGMPDESELAGLNTAQKMQAQKMAKMKGDIIESFHDFGVNKPLNPTDFQTAQKIGGGPGKKRAGAPKPRREKP